MAAWKWKARTTRKAATMKNKPHLVKCGGLWMASLVVHRYRWWFGGVYCPYAAVGPTPNSAYDLLMWKVRG